MSGSQVIVGGGTHLYALDINTGEVNWATEIPAQEPLHNTTTEIVTSDNVAICGYSYSLENGEDFAGLAGLNVESGEIKWNKTHDEIASTYDSWLGIQSLLPPIGDRVIVAGWNQAFWVNISTGKLEIRLWLTPDMNFNYLMTHSIQQMRENSTSGLSALAD